MYGSGWGGRGIAKFDTRLTTRQRHTNYPARKSRILRALIDILSATKEWPPADSADVCSVVPQQRSSAPYLRDDRHGSAITARNGCRTMLVRGSDASRIPQVSIRLAWPGEGASGADQSLAGHQHVHRMRKSCQDGRQSIFTTRTGFDPPASRSGEMGLWTLS